MAKRDTTLENAYYDIMFGRIVKNNAIITFPDVPDDPLADIENAYDQSDHHGLFVTFQSGHRERHYVGEIVIVEDK
jgi:hypothetical protein